MVRFLLIIFFLMSCERKFTVNEFIKSSTKTPSATTYPSTWIKQMGNGELGSNAISTENSEEVSDMAIDKDGNIIIAGNVEGSFGSNQTESSLDGYILKLDSNGNFLWLLQLSDDQPLINESGGFEWLYSITVDTDGNIYATGETYSSFIEGNAGTSDSDIFVVKVSPDGQILWAKQFGDTSVANSSGAKLQDYVESLFPGYVVNTEAYDYANGITTDSLGNIFIAGSTSGSWIGTNGGSADALMIKLDSSGDIVWVRQIGSEYNSVGDVNLTSGSQILRDVATDKDGNAYSALYVTSHFGETSNVRDCVVLKFSKFGNLLWLKQLGNGAFGSNVASTTGIDSCEDIAIDSNSNVYVAGFTYSNLNETNGGNGDIFVMKLLTDGTFDWLKHFGDHEGIGMGSNLNNTDGNDIVQSIFIDSNDVIYVGGHSNRAFGEANDASRQDAIVMSLNSDGSFNWVKHLGSGAVGSSLLDEGFNTDNDDVLWGVGVDSDGKIIGAGNTGSNLAEENSGGFDVFVFKMSQ